MTSKKEDLGKNTYKITVEVEAAKFDEAVNKVYNKNKKKFKVNGFRNGSAPKEIIMKMYGEQVFYEEALNMLLNSTYAEAIKEQDIMPVTMPMIDVVEIGCGKNLVYTAEVAVKPAVELGDYKGIKVKKEKVEVSDEEIEEALKNDAEKNARLVSIEDRNTKSGDTVNIDFEGSVKGIKFEGGTAKGYDLVLGSHSFIDNFEEQLEDKKIGEEVIVKVKFPEEYGNDKLNGQDAEFKVKINGITEKVMPELNDEFAQDVSEFDTLEDYKKDLKKQLKKSKEKAADEKRKAEILEKLAETSKIEIPDMMIDGQVQGMMNNFAKQLQMQGMQMNDFMKFTGMTVEELKGKYAQDAARDLKIALTLEAIAKEEKIEITEEDMNKEMTKLTKESRMPKEQVEKVFATRGEEIKEQLTMEKTIEFVVENSKNSK